LLLVRSFEVTHQLVGGDKVDAKALVDRLHAQGYSQVCLSYTRWSKEDHIGCLNHKGQGLELSNLPLVDGGLKSEVEVLQSLGEREVSQSSPRLQITLPAGLNLHIEEIRQEVQV